MSIGKNLRTHFNTILLKYCYELYIWSFYSPTLLLFSLIPEGFFSITWSEWFCQILEKKPSPFLSRLTYFLIVCPSLMAWSYSKLSDWSRKQGWNQDNYGKQFDLPSILGLHLVRQKTVCKFYLIISDDNSYQTFVLFFQKDSSSIIL